MLPFDVVCVRTHIRQQWIVYNLFICRRLYMKTKKFQDSSPFVQYNKINNDIAEGDSAFLSTLEKHCKPRLAPRSPVFPRVNTMHWHLLRCHYLYIISLSFWHWAYLKRYQVHRGPPDEEWYDPDTASRRLWVRRCRPWTTSGDTWHTGNTRDGTQGRARAAPSRTAAKGRYSPRTSCRSGWNIT